MCGIAGIVHPDPQFRIPQLALLRMRDALTHRGPDDAGFYLRPGVGLTSRRLAILDVSSRGRMPMSTPDGRYWIVHNGEIYNFQELRSPLERRGHVFRSGTDTEVLLALYAEEGVAMLDRLDGMFAFAIWDARERRLFLARDHVGIKPLFYAHLGSALCFASEQKALFAAGVAARFDSSAWEELLCFRYLAGEETVFAGVRRLLSGHFMTWRDGRSSIRRWWNLGDRANARTQDQPREAAAWFREAFDGSVARRRISDVPIGILLSGGLDSASIAASLALQNGPGVRSFTVGFTEPEFDESSLARQVALRWALEYHQLTPPPEELALRLPRAAWLQGEPMAHANHVQLWAISEYSKSRVTVLLSGEGADEVLGGYVRYRPLTHPRVLGWARHAARELPSSRLRNGRWAKLVRFLALGSTDRFVLYNACNVLPEDLRQLGMRPIERYPYREQILEEARALYPYEPVRQAMYSDQHTFLESLLDRNDRMTMGASIECRVPFLSREILEGVAALPSRTLFAGRGHKPLLRRAVGDRMPEAVLRGRKWGFAVPWGRYLRQPGELRERVTTLPQHELIRNGPFEPSLLRRLVEAFLVGDVRHDALVLQLFMIALWHESMGKPASAASAPVLRIVEDSPAVPFTDS